ncbi:MAG TPA: neutral zinc metallopeptidase, partial [Chloroflexota bacterium]|nr:neutral zinc metallopeptidase [Chloroflexota bacterium]
PLLTSCGGVADKRRRQATFSLRSVDLSICRASWRTAQVSSQQIEQGRSDARSWRRLAVVACCLFLSAACNGGRDITTGTTTTTSELNSTQAHYNEIIGIAVGTQDTPSDIDTFWKVEFPRAFNKPYTSPKRFISYSTSRPASNACGPLQPNNAYYCYADNSIAWDDDWLLSGFKADRPAFSVDHDMVPLTVIAHEWGHHISSLAGLPQLSIQRELQADCFAGLYLAHAAEDSKIVTLETSDVREAAMAVFALGDDPFSRSQWHDAGVHGTAWERSMAFSRAYITEEPRYCTAYSSFARRDDLRVGPYTVTPIAPSAVRDLSPTTVEATSAHLGFTAQMAWLPQVQGSARAALQGVAQRWFDAAVRQIGNMEPFDAPGLPPGTAASMRYEQLQQGRPIHGALFLHVGQSGGALLIDAFRSGAAPSGDAGWQDIGDYLFASAFGLRRE